MIFSDWVGHYVSLPYEEVDCWALCKLIYFERYSIELGNVETQRSLIKEGDWRDILANPESPIEGDILLFKSSPVNRHVGIILTSEYMIHSINPIGSVIERWTSRNWKTQLRAIYRYKKR